MRIKFLSPPGSNLQPMNIGEDSRLRGKGPWSAVRVGNQVEYTRGTGDVAWGPWKNGLDGWMYALPAELPKFSFDGLKVDTDYCTVVELTCGVAWPVFPASVDNTVLGLDLEIDPSASCTEYGALANKLYEKAESAEGLKLSDKDLVKFCRMALMRSVGVTEEEIAAYRILTVNDLDAIFHAAAGIPKAEPGAAN